MDRTLSNALCGISTLLDALETRIIRLLEQAGGEIVIEPSEESTDPVQEDAPAPGNEEAGCSGDSIYGYPILGSDVVECRVARIRARDGEIELQFADVDDIKPWFGLDECLRSATLLFIAENICEYLPEK